MKSKFALAIIVLAASLFTGCVHTKLVGSRKLTEDAPKQFKSLGIVVISPKMSNRAIIEMAIADAFRAKGIKAMGTFDIFPMAGNKEEIGKKMDQEALQLKIRQRVKDAELDGLLIISLLDKNQETHYVGGTSFGISAPVYGYPYYGYYSYAYSNVYNTGYYETTTDYFIESNMYDVATEKLIWTGQTKTEDPESVEKEAPELAKILVDEILLKQVVAP